MPSEALRCLAEPCRALQSLRAQKEISVGRLEAISPENVHLGWRVRVQGALFEQCGSVFGVCKLVFGKTRAKGVEW